MVFSQILMPEYETNILGNYLESLTGKLVFNEESDMNVIVKELIQLGNMPSGYELIGDIFRN